jgi:hypothetical protein
VRFDQVAVPEPGLTLTFGVALALLIGCRVGGRSRRAPA